MSFTCIIVVLGIQFRKVENLIFYGFHSIDKNNIDHDHAVKLTKLIIISFLLPIDRKELW